MGVVGRNGGVTGVYRLYWCGAMWLGVPRYDEVQQCSILVSMRYSSFLSMYQGEMGNNLNLWHVFEDVNFPEI